jgi:hypothetical protein
VAAYDPGQWHDFAASFAAAAGALLGLAFVAISFNLDAILKLKALPDRAIETLVFFAYALAGSLLLQVPGPPGVALGAVVTITTSLGGLYWLAGAMTVPTASGLINSWVLLVEIRR